MAFGRHEHVRRLEVAVDDALPVRGVEALGDLHRVLDGLARRQPRAASQELLKALAHEQLLDQVGSALLSSDVVQDDDVRVVERGGGSRLLLEAAQSARVLREGRREDLDGDVAPEPRVARPVHLSHAARADAAGDLVGTELLVGAQARGRLTAVHGACSRRVRTLRDRRSVL